MHPCDWQGSILQPKTLYTVYKVFAPAKPNVLSTTDVDCDEAGSGGGDSDRTAFWIAPLRRIYFIVIITFVVVLLLLLLLLIDWLLAILRRKRVAAETDLPVTDKGSECNGACLSCRMQRLMTRLHPTEVGKKTTTDWLSEPIWNDPHSAR